LTKEGLSKMRRAVQCGSFTRSTAVLLPGQLGPAVGWAEEEPAGTEKVAEVTEVAGAVWWRVKLHLGRQWKWCLGLTR